MLVYLLKRLAAAIPILFGVILVTFLLFHVAGGDPVLVMLGKNARPQEAEQLRRRLHADRPLFFGRVCKTECYAPLDFAAAPGAAGLDAGAKLDAGTLLLPPGGRLVLKQNFAPDPARRTALRLKFRGELQATAPGLTLDFRTGSRPAVVASPLPGTPAELLLTAGPDGAQVWWVRAESWQDNPFDSQFLATLREVADIRRGPDGRWRPVFFDFGNSFATGEPVRRLILEGLPPSLFLMGSVFLIETLLGVALALAAAWRRESWADHLIMFASVAGMSISYLVYIILGQFVLGYWLNFFPVWGWESPRNLVLPVLVGVIGGLGGGVRYYRTAFLNELYREHVRTAQAKGCGPVRILAMHVLPNALVPVITRISVILPFLFTGSLLLESFFGIPGLGYAGIQALANGDLPVLKALVVAGAVLFILCNLAADLLSAWADPRLRLK